MVVAGLGYQSHAIRNAIVPAPNPSPIPNPHYSVSCGKECSYDPHPSTLLSIWPEEGP